MPENPRVKRNVAMLDQLIGDDLTEAIHVIVGGQRSEAVLLARLLERLRAIEKDVGDLLNDAGLVGESSTWHPPFRQEETVWPEQLNGPARAEPGNDEDPKSEPAARGTGPAPLEGGHPIPEEAPEKEATPEPSDDSAEVDHPLEAEGNQRPPA